MSEIRIAPLTREALPQVVAIHERAFAESAITKLGSEAVRRYYAWLLEGPHDAALMGAWQGSTLVGFCAAGVFRGAMNGFLRANRKYLALHVLTHPWLITSSLIRDRMRSALRITVRFSRHRRPSGPAPVPGFGVLSIATDPRIRGAGAGRALMLEAEARARANGFAKLSLTVNPDNARAIRFYEQLGWRRSGDAGAWTGTMVRELSSAQ